MTNTETRPAMTAHRFMIAITTTFLALVFLTLPAVVPARAEVEIQEVTSDKGVTAWLVEDYTVPIIAVRFAFKGGSTQDPAGKEGLANLMTGLFDEGAGELDADTFQERLDEVGAEMSFNATRDAVYGQMRMLSDDSGDAFELLGMAVTDPRFDQEPIDRIRAQIMTGIQRDMRDPNALGQDQFARALYGEHPYARRSDGTPETLGSVTAEDLHRMHERMFARSNVSIAVVGAIDAEALKAELDRVFGDLPETASSDTVAQVEPKLDQLVSYPYDLPQATIQLVYPGLKRDDPEFFPAFIMNHILGGGVFSSRLFNEVREKRGLAYGVGSGLDTGDYSNSLFIGTSTRSDRAQETLDIIRQEVKRMADEGPTEDELARAKTYLVGAYPINNLDSSSAVARTLVELQKEGRGIDYIQRRIGLIEAVTLEQVKAAGQRLLEAEPAVLVIGPELGNGG
ncbi:pitrilysin family protein [Mesorhizobium sp. CAU 1732]|uniref:M16 family metallopeptidase n=1 Tax=Mesorhizobium sp. CAU 1732 TaxID=3140358 RepID=UPI0032601D22